MPTTTKLIPHLRYAKEPEEGGGKPIACGWISDRFGLRWQITASALHDMMAGPDKAKAKRVTVVMLKQTKIDLAQLQAAFDGR